MGMDISQAIIQERMLAEQARALQEGAIPAEGKVTDGGLTKDQEKLNRCLLPEEQGGDLERQKALDGGKRVLRDTSLDKEQGLAPLQAGVEEDASRLEEVPDGTLSEGDELVVEEAAEDTQDKPQVVQNKEDGCRREQEVEEELAEEYPEEEGYKVLPERDLLDKDGNPVKDPESGLGRRVDFVVTRNGEAVRSIEVTSPTAPKDAQLAKEDRVKDAGGTYVRDPDSGELIDVSDTKTEVIRRD